MGDDIEWRWNWPLIALLAGTLALDILVAVGINVLIRRWL